MLDSKSSAVTVEDISGYPTISGMEIHHKSSWSHFKESDAESTNKQMENLTTSRFADNNDLLSHHDNTYDATTIFDETEYTIDTSDTLHDTYIDNPLFWVLICIIVVALLGNVITCVLVRCDVTLHHMTYYFVTSLCMLHIMTSLTVMPFAVLVTIQGSFTHSVALCKLWTSLDLFICNNTCLHLAFAIMDAYLRLKEPLRHRGRGSPLRCSRITWLLSPWLISLVQASAQFMLSESDHPIVHDGLCFIYNNNFLIVGSIFSYGIPNAITVAFYSLCYKEIKALKTGRYFDENGSLRRQYTHHQHGSDDNSSQSDDDVDDVDTCIADVINHGDDVNDVIEPQTPEKVPEIVQMEVVATKRRPVGNNLVTRSPNGETSHFNNITSFSNDHASLQGATNGCLISSTGHTNRAFANSTMDDHYDIPETTEQLDQVTDQHNTSCTVLLETEAHTNKTPTENKPHEQQTQLKNPDPEIQKCEADHVIMNQECPDECLRHELELSRVLFMLMLSVCLSWLPLSVGQFVYAVCPDCVRRLTMGELLCLKWAGYICGVWGPFIYVKCSEYVRCALRQLVTCQYCR